MLLRLCILAIVKPSPAWACGEDKSEFPLCASIRGSLSLKRTCPDLAEPGEEISSRPSQHLPSPLSKTIFKFYWETRWVLWGKGEEEYPRCALKGLKLASFLALPLFSPKAQKGTQGHPLELSCGGRRLFQGGRQGPTVILCPPPAALGFASSESPTACDSHCRSHEADHHDMLCHWHCKHKLRNQVLLLLVFCSLVEARGAD